MRTPRLPAITLAFVLGAGGCARGPAAPVPVTAPAADDARLKEMLAERDQRIRELEGRMGLLEAEAREIRDRLGESRASISGLRETVRIGSHVRAAEAAADAQGPRPVLKLHGDPARPKASRRQPLPPLPPPTDERLPIAPLPPASVESLEAAPGSPSAAYRQALDLVRKRDFDRALAALSTYLVRYPGDARTADVLFWRGEVQFALSKFEGALASFHGALEAGPSEERASDALLKVGLCHRELGAPDRARLAFERLKSEFPHSRAARLVSQEDAS